MILGVVGLPGYGKSYLLTCMCLEWLKRPKSKVISNFHPTQRAYERFGDRWRFGLWADMLECEAGTACVVDEANMWFSSREWKNQSASDLSVFKQSRKHGISLWWCDQHENRVDCAIREVTHMIWRMDRFFGLSVAYCEEPSGGKRMGWKLIVRNPKVWRYYDSFECIGNRFGEGYHIGKNPEVDADMYRYEGFVPQYRRAREAIHGRVAEVRGIAKARVLQGAGRIERAGVAP